MSQFSYFKIINPIVKILLKSPLHFLLSGNTLLLEFVGRKSGKRLSTPVSYHLQDGHLHCFSSKRFVWWRNLVEVNSIEVVLEGKRYSANPLVLMDEPEVMQKALTGFLQAVPRDAAHSGVRLNKDKEPDAVDIVDAVESMVYIRITLL
jgi:hypothetical protein